MTERGATGWLVAMALIGTTLVPGCGKKKQSEPGKQSREEIAQLKQEAAELSPMVRIEGGCFRMGNDNPPPAPNGPESEEDKLCVKGREGAVECFGVYEDEMPAHDVCLDPFEIDRHEVTFGAFQKCAETLICKPSDLGSDVDFWGPNRPAVGVEWQAARAFCEWIGRRLPTEAEWELAARGTDGRTFPWGEQEPKCGEIAMRLGEEKDACDRFGTKNVELYPMDKSPFGLMDMGANVREWVSDFYHPGYYLALRDQKTTNPAGPEHALEVFVNSTGEGEGAQNLFLTEQQRVVRGGTWLFSEPLTSYRTTNRRGVDETQRLRGELLTIGFRCARSIAAPPAP
ncbi:MAG: SUMF1/EgtB/PvdO family nonheme iron enzyme [Deltaproteobacteria bacterium]|nr:SUMF1/EgtB/PvdO family nonheme iron enzyme [Deltaproteobacteria bacterium]